LKHDGDGNGDGDGVHSHDDKENRSVTHTKDHDNKKTAIHHPIANAASKVKEGITINIPHHTAAHTHTHHHGGVESVEPLSPTL
jgi:hypothetical protein